MKPSQPVFHTRPRTVFAMLGLAATLAVGDVSASPTDLDEDSKPNRSDLDVDGDGLINRRDRNVDGGICRKGRLRGKFVGDRLNNDDPREKDIDGDGLPDSKDKDIDGDRVNNLRDDDCDGDGKGRSRDDDDDGDNIDDSKDDDDDNDGIGDDEENSAELYLTKSAAAPIDSRGKVEVEQDANGEVKMKVKGRNLAPGSYQIVVNGSELGSLDMQADGDRTEGETRFESTPDESGELPLPFTPYGLSIVIMKDGVVFFSGLIPTPSDVFPPEGGSGGSETTILLKRSASLSAAAEASLEIQRGAKGVVGLELEVERVPVGLYEFRVGGVEQGLVAVVAVANKTKGKLRFYVRPDDRGEFMLDFQVAGKTVTVTDGTDIMFEGRVPSAP